VSKNGWGPDPEIEQFLLDAGVSEWVFHEQFPLAKIDREKSIHNQARLHNPYNEDHVLSLAMLMEKTPEKISAMITHWVGNSQILLSGNHRTGAATDVLGWKALPNYEITQRLTEAQIRHIAIHANLNLEKEILILPTPDRVEHAIWCVDALNMTQKDAAEKVRISARALSKEMNLRQTLGRFDELGLVRVRNKIKTVSSLERIGGLRDNEVFKETAKLIAETGMSSEDAGSLITRINKLRSVKEQLQLVADVGLALRPQVVETAGGNVPIPKALADLRRILTMVTKFSVDELSKVSIEKSERTQLRRAIEKASRDLISISSML
jgi:hypothetical protein